MTSPPRYRIATALQDRRFLRGEPETERLWTDAIYVNGLLAMIRLLLVSDKSPDIIAAKETPDQSPNQFPNQEPHLARMQNCGCIVCMYETEQCNGCGSYHCGSYHCGHHPVGEFRNPIFEGE